MPVADLPIFAAVDQAIAVTIDTIAEVFPAAPKVTEAACPKCLGHGVIRAHSHILGGECFACRGTGEVK